jgi:hypothetical protein
MHRRSCRVFNDPPCLALALALAHRPQRHLRRHSVRVHPLSVQQGGDVYLLARAAVRRAGGSLRKSTRPRLEHDLP